MTLTFKHLSLAKNKNILVIFKFGIKLSNVNLRPLTGLSDFGLVLGMPEPLVDMGMEIVVTCCCFWDNKVN